MDVPVKKVKIMLCDRVAEFPDPGPIPSKTVECYGCGVPLWIGVRSAEALGDDGIAVCETHHSQLIDAVKTSGNPIEVAPLSPGQSEELLRVLSRQRQN